MLIGFKVRNFRSFRAEQELGYVTSADRAHETTHCVRTGVRAVPRLLRAALVFGPNAAGKSNLVRALATLRDLVLGSTSFTEAQFAERHTPFQMDASLGSTQFTAEVLLAGVRYRYTAAFNSQRITTERLLVYRTGKSQRWFQRHFDPARQVEQWEPFSPSFTGPREMWRKATRPKALFLTTAAQLNSELLQPLFHWFERGVETLFSGDIVEPARIAAYIKNPDLKARILRVVRSADIPVDDFRVVDHEPQDSPVARGGPSGGRVEARPLIEYLHSQPSGKAIWLSAAFEAAGTHKLLGLAGPLLHALDTGKLLAIDEFDANLHPLLARLLVRLIHHPTPAGRGAQLLLTSQNSTLMDLDILRRDEIWLAQLDPTHATRLAPLIRQSPRKHDVIAKAYLRGRYGAVPRVQNDALEALWGAAVDAP
jgi:uncharacterized protein